ncbi:bone sialoprotein 2-like [Tripterygium wilfordii]|uniref:bone sialoprotein 2-like n=1 Tax=Tripterygium wilfordii TaxID=458696 RepID=UPI0018F7E555|nr:bone sialoprotein 2-like [Tripterygium wilfordii]
MHLATHPESRATISNTIAKDNQDNNRNDTERTISEGNQADSLFEDVNGTRGNKNNRDGDEDNEEKDDDYCDDQVEEEAILSKQNETDNTTEENKVMRNQEEELQELERTTTRNQGPVKLLKDYEENQHDRNESEKHLIAEFGHSNAVYL